MFVLPKWHRFITSTSLQCNNNLSQRSLLHSESKPQSGAILGLGLGIVGTSVPWLFPTIFTSDPIVIQQAGRELKFVSLSMSGCFSFGALILLLANSKGYGLPGYWCSIVGFQRARFFPPAQSPYSTLWRPIP